MRLVCSLVAAAVLAGAFHTAQAQPALTAPVEPAVPLKAKRPSVATNLSLIVPLVTMSAGMVLLSNGGDAAGAGAVLLLGGGILGPAAGHWYIGNVGGIGITIRSGATLGMFAGMIGILANSDYDCFDPDPECLEGAERADRRIEQSMAFGVGSLAVFVASAAYDIYAAGRDADRWNLRHRVTFTPTVVPAARGGIAPGAALSLRF